MKVYKPYSNKQIKGFEGLYYIYPNGEIKRQYKNHSRNLKPRIGKNGYIYFDLWKKHQGTVAGICDVIHGRCKKHRGLTFILMEK